MVEVATSVVVDNIVVEVAEGVDSFDVIAVVVGIVLLVAEVLIVSTHSQHLVLPM